MEVSQKYLEKLKGWEYDEYTSLSKIDFKGKKYKDIFSFIFQCILCLLFGIIYILINQQDSVIWWKTFGLTFLIGLLFPLSWLPNILLFDSYYIKFFEHFSHKTKDFLRFEELQIKFVDVEKKIENEATIILKSFENEVVKRLSENRELNQYLHRKRNPDLYSYEINKILNNHELNQRILPIIKKNLDYIKYDSDNFKHFEKLKRDLSYEHIYFANVVGSSKHSYNKKPILNSPNINNSNNKDLTSNQQISPIQTQNNNYTNTVKTNKEDSVPKISKEQTDSKVKSTQKDKNIIELPKSSVFNSDQELKQLKLDFDSAKITVKDSLDIPKKRDTPKYEPIIKASPAFYLNLASKKIEIGMKGELLAMEHERLRLIDAGENPDYRLRHKSVLDGDGFGYDILSFENGENVYIEVKTTTGSFWSNLFFTQNEFNKMNELGEQYFLYRICNLSLEANQGDLFIFSGKNMITSYFDFNSKMYVLTEKQNKI